MTFIQYLRICFISLFLLLILTNLNSQNSELAFSSAVSLNKIENKYGEEQTSLDWVDFSTMFGLEYKINFKSLTLKAGSELIFQNGSYSVYSSYLNQYDFVKGRINISFGSNLVDAKGWNLSVYSGLYLSDMISQKTKYSYISGQFDPRSTNPFKEIDFGLHIEIESIWNNFSIAVRTSQGFLNINNEFNFESLRNIELISFRTYIKLIQLN